MKRKVKSLLLVIILCLGLAGCGATSKTEKQDEQGSDKTAADSSAPDATQSDETNSPNSTSDKSNSNANMAKAYAKVLQNVVNLYGYCTAAPDEYGYISPSPDDGIASDYIGLAYADLIDFDADGTPELYLFYAASANEGSEDTYAIYEQLWRWNGSAAEKVHEEEYIKGLSYKSGYDSVSLYEADERTYLAYDYGYSNSGIASGSLTVSEYANGALEEYQTISENSMWEIDEYSLEINGKTIYDQASFAQVAQPAHEDEVFAGHSAEAEAFYNDVDASYKQTFLFSTAEIQYPSWTTNDPSALLSRLQAEAGSTSSQEYGPEYGAYTIQIDNFGEGEGGNPVTLTFDGARATPDVVITVAYDDLDDNGEFITVYEKETVTLVTVHPNSSIAMSGAVSIANEYYEHVGRPMVWVYYYSYNEAEDYYVFGNSSAEILYAGPVKDNYFSDTTVYGLKSATGGNDYFIALG